MARSELLSDLPANAAQCQPDISNRMFHKHIEFNTVETQLLISLPSPLPFSTSPTKPCPAQFPVTNKNDAIYSVPQWKILDIILDLSTCSTLMIYH